ncbi:MAG: sugar phosphate isomerase/epimerase [Spirochaetaceae bacterium]|nr:sugar phosphate isomerase/epimerase [Spirochaetaceae bacterium]
MKYSVCNELFGDLGLEEAARIAKRTGYLGLEFAPYTIFGDFSPGALRDGTRRAREELRGEGLAFVGFHWLLAKPEGLHIASPDMKVRERTVDHLRRLIDCAGELGGGVLVFGSPRQRGSSPGVSKVEAETALTEALRALGPHAASRSCSILVEALSPEQTDVVNSLDEAARIAEAAGSPAVATMLDFHNARCEADPWNVLIARHFDRIRHVHANEIDGRAPGTGNSDFGPSFAALAARGYAGWISIEIFETPRDPASLLRGSMELFERLEGREGKA